MATDDQCAKFIARQRVLLKRERDAEVERSSLLLSNCGPKLLEQKGLSLGGLGVVGVNIGLGGKTLVELERPTAYHANPTFPPHAFRPGDLARIEANVTATGASRKGKKTHEESKHSVPEGVVYRVSDTRIIVAIDASDTALEALDLPERCRVLKLANSVTYDRMEAALDRLERRVLGTTKDEKSSPESLRLTQVLLGICLPSDRCPLKEVTFFDESLNPSQKGAVRFCLESPEVSCIHGPPGTGKTHTLIEIIRQLTSSTPVNPKPLRLLVCGASNLSVDNILERLLALPPAENGERLRVTRIGHPARVMAHEGILDSTLEAKATRTDQANLAKDVKNELETTLGILSGKGKGVKGKGPRGTERKKLWDEVKALRKEYRQREGGVVKSVLTESQVVIATCHSAGGRQLFNEEFDAVIIDEATQAIEAVCWVPIFKAKKLILAGDPMQLPPTVLSLDGRQKRGANKTKSKSKGDGKSTSRAKDSLPSERTRASSASDADSANISDLDSGSSIETSEAIERSPSPAEAVVPLPAKPDTQPSKIYPILRPPRSLETTLFERLEKMYGPDIKRMLKVQYRMHSQICAFPSKILYASKLESHPSVANHLLRDLGNAHANTDEDANEILTTPVVFFDTAGCEYYERAESSDGDEGSKSNENEAMVVKNWIAKLVEVGLAPEQIAIITPYQAQVTFLSSLLRPLYGTGLEIGSVDGMQGREKEAVIISLVRSNATREVGFLKEKRRLNGRTWLAMTRARRHLCVVGDSSTVSHGGSYLKKWLAWLEANADVRYAGLE